MQDHTQKTLFSDETYTHPVFSEPEVGEHPLHVEQYLRILSRSLVPLDGRSDYGKVQDWAFDVHRVTLLSERDSIESWVGLVTMTRHRHTHQLDLLTKTHVAQERPAKRANWVSQREWIKRVHESCMTAALHGFPAI